MTTTPSMDGRLVSSRSVISDTAHDPTTHREVRPHRGIDPLNDARLPSQFVYFLPLDGPPTVECIGRRTLLLVVKRRYLLCESIALLDRDVCLRPLGDRLSEVVYPLFFRFFETLIVLIDVRELGVNLRVRIQRWRTGLNMAYSRDSMPENNASTATAPLLVMTRGLTSASSIHGLSR